MHHSAMISLSQLSLLPGSLRAKFIAAFSCMTVLPFLVCFYIVATFVWPFAESAWLTSVIILLTMLISFCGFRIMEQIICSILDLSREAKRLAGRTSFGLNPAGAQDEVATIRKSLSSLAEDVEKMTIRVKQLEVRDEKLGVFTERYIRDFLMDEMKRSTMYQRPCSVLVARFMNTPDVSRVLEDDVHCQWALSSVSAFLRKYITGIGRIGRLGQHGLCLVLPEYNRRQAVELCEKIRAEADSINWDKLATIANWEPQLVFSTAAAPVDGVDAATLLQKCNMSGSAA